MLASSGEDKPFLCDSTWSPTVLLPWARTCLSRTTLLGVPPACFLWRAQAFPTRLCKESCLLASPSEDKPSSFAWPARVPPACFLGRGQACLLPQARTSLLCSRGLLGSYLVASIGED